MSGQLHESFEERRELKTSSDRAFGLTVGGILVALALIRAWLHDGLNWISWLMLVVGLVLVVLGQLRPELLAPLNKLWTKLGLLLFRIVNPVVMFLIFAVAIVPIGLIMRWRGHDPMRLKRDPAAPSYWIERSPPGPAPETMTNQF